MVVGTRWGNKERKGDEMAQLIVVFGLIECVFGWLQLFGFAASGNSMYPATGTFYNPGPFCCFLAVIVPVALNEALSANKKVLRWLSLAYLVLSIGIMPALMGRTGWIAAILGCGIVVAGRYAGVSHSFKKGGIGIYIISAIGIICIALALLYFIKPESAQGRVLMWMVAFRAMIAHPLGVGWDRVAGAFGKAQEDYFMLHPDSPFASVAGAPEYVFNEYLQLGIAFGFAGFIVFVMLVVWGMVVTWRLRSYGLCGAVTAFAAVCFSSYPLQFVEFYLLIFLIGVAIVFSLRKFPLWSKAGVCAITVALVSVPAYGIMERKRQMGEWERMSNMIRYNLSDNMIAECDSLMDEMGWSVRYLFDYGKALRGNGHFDKSNMVLKKGVEISSDPMFLNLIGRNYEDKGEVVDAEKYYIRARNRLPNRLYPYYLLTKLYANGGEGSAGKFRKAYEEAMALQVKVESPATREMRKELSGIMNKCNTYLTD